MAALPRRTFLSAAAAAPGGVVVGGAARPVGGPVLSRMASWLTIGRQSCGIEHIVVMMMENRSFDHFLGWLPDADGRQAGLSYVDAGGTSHATYPLAPDFQGCGHQDPDHSYAGGRVQYNGGACGRRARRNQTVSVRYHR